MPRRLALVAGSLFAAWHTAVILLGAAPPSYLHAQLYPYVRPYAEFLHLNGGWAFFAPDPSAGRPLRYAVEDASGHRTAFLFSEALQRSDPAYLRLTTLSAAVDEDYPAVVNSVAQRLCRRHAALAPARIVFTQAQQIRLTPEQHEAGQRPLDAALLQLNELKPVACKT